MSRFTSKAISKIFAGLLVGAGFAVVPLAVQAATTNTFNFSNTTAAATTGPVNPANGATSIGGTSLTVGDMVVFDGVVIDVPGSGGDAWGAVELDYGGGYLGLVNATLGVLVETGTNSGYQCQLYVNGSGTPIYFGVPQGSRTNRVRIELTCTHAGSTTNMNYVVKMDQGVSNVFSGVLSGTGINFANNTIALTFGANNRAHQFIQTQPMIAVSAPTPANAIVAAGAAATFTATITQGYPLGTAQQWLSNGVPIAGATSLTYTTPPTTASYNGAQYSIVVTNLFNPANVVTSAVATLTIRSVPGIVPFNFTATAIPNSSQVNPLNPPVAIAGSSLLAGDTVVFDGIVTTNGPLTGSGNGWASINLAPGGYQGATTAQLGLLVRLGTGAGQLYVNGGGPVSPNPTSSGALANHAHIELYPSATGSTTNMGWLVEIDQNLTGTFLPALSGTGLTFPGNTIPLNFGSWDVDSFITQDPQSPVSVFQGPTPAFQVVAAGAPVTVGVTVKGWSPAFQWYKNGAPIPNATNRDYTLAATTLADNGDQFKVVVSNRLDSLNVITSAVASVSVLIPNNFTWYPAADFTTWDTNTANWTTNGGVSETNFSSGGNVTFDSLGYNIGGNIITLTNDVFPNAVTVNVSAFDQYVMTGSGGVSGANLLVTGDGTGTLDLQTPTGVSFGSATINNATLQIGYLAQDSLFGANSITNNGTINFANTTTTLLIPAVITGSGSIYQNGLATTALTATNSVYTIGAINAGILAIASTPNPGVILNNSELQPNSPASVLVIPNAMTGAGHYYFSGFQTTILTGLSSHTGQNVLFWSDVIVDNPQALGDASSGSSVVSGADRFGGLYLSNNITWSQPLQLEPRNNTGVAATAPHVSNWSGTNIITSPLTFATGQGGSEINVEAAAGQLTIDTTSTLANNAGNNDNNLNLQGSATGIWNGVLSDSSTLLNVVKRGTGTWTLGGVNTYTGTTTVSNGTLLITGQLGSGNVSVQSGGTLGGNGGTIAGPVSVAAGGTLAPGGTGAGVLTIGNSLTLAPGSFTSVKINKTAATEDRVAGVSAVTYGGTLVVNNLSGTLTTSDTFTLFSPGASASNFSSISGSPGAGLAYSFTNGVLSVVAAGVKPVPRITHISQSGTTLTISGTNGAPNGQYELLGSTNVAKPLNQWTPLLTNNFDVNGIINLSTNIVNPALPREFYILLQ